jgi:hypothetical protein
MRLDLVPERFHHRVDVEADPAIVLAGITPGRRLEIAAGRRRAIEDDVVILARIPPEVVNRRDFQRLLLSEPGVLGGKERLVVLDANAAEPVPSSDSLRSTPSKMIGSPLLSFH